ncbi:pro-interleukin-16 [Xenentodon cancila]
MDLSLLPTPLSEHNKQRTGRQFTVRSANSPSYSLTRRPDKSEGSATPPLLLPLQTSSYSDLTGLLYSDIKTEGPKGKKHVLDPSAWVGGWNPEYKCLDDGEGGYEDDDDSTQVDEDSNYDSDSGESSVTITSNMSQSDRRSFSVSLSELCNFTGPDYDSDDDDVWQSTTRRSVSLSSDVSDFSVFSCVSMLPTEELDKLLQDVRNLGDDALERSDDVQVVVLHKEVGVGLGFSLAGGVDQNKPITVHKVFHAGVAAQEGSIREGDQILSINGTALSGSAHLEVLRVLKKAKAQTTGIVVLRRDDVSSPLKKGVQEYNEEATQAQYETGQRVCMQLQKMGRNLGFSLQGGVGSSEGNRPLTVQKIFQGGPIDKVCPGDVVIEIEGMSMVGMRRLEAWTFIKNLQSGPVEVVLRRPLKHLQT